MNGSGEVCRATDAAQTWLWLRRATCPKLTNENHRLNAPPRLLRWRNETMRAQTDADSEAEESPEAKTEKMNQTEEHTTGRKRQPEELQTGTAHDVAPSEDGEE